jgi:hypothetical protein
MGGGGKKPCLVEFRSSFILILLSILTTVLVTLKKFLFLFLIFLLPLIISRRILGLILSSYSVVFYTTSVNSRKGKATNKETGNNDGKEIIITLSILTIWFFDSVHVIQLDCPLVVTTGQYFALTSYFFFGVHTPLTLFLLLFLAATASVASDCWTSFFPPFVSFFHLPIQEAHTKDEEMKRPRPGDEMFGKWKEMEFWLGWLDLHGSEDVAFD